jgi:hypothetical protein
MSKPKSKRALVFWMSTELFIVFPPLTDRSSRMTRSANQRLEVPEGVAERPDLDQPIVGVLQDGRPNRSRIGKAEDSFSVLACDVLDRKTPATKVSSQIQVGGLVLAAGWVRMVHHCFILVSSRGVIRIFIVSV